MLVADPHRPTLYYPERSSLPITGERPQSPHLSLCAKFEARRVGIWSAIAGAKAIIERMRSPRLVDFCRAVRCDRMWRLSLARRWEVKAGTLQRRPQASHRHRAARGGGGARSASVALLAETRPGRSASARCRQALHQTSTRPQPAASGLRGVGRASDIPEHSLTAGAGAAGRSVRRIVRQEG